VCSRRAWKNAGVGLQTQLRRAVAVYRFVALAYPVLLGALAFEDLRHPVAAALLVIVLVGWTAAVSYRYTRKGYEDLVVYADLAVTAAAVAVSAWALAVDGRAVPISLGPWLAGVVLAWGAAWGRRSGAVAGGVIAVFGMVFRGGISENTVNEAALLVLTGFTVGHLVRLGVEAEERTRRAVERTAAAKERERLARDIHDSVLQVLALVKRRGAGLDGEAGELARLAGEQEAALRALVTSRAVPASDDRADADLMALLGPYASSTVSIASPAEAVRLPARVAGEVAAAVGAALDNVARHCAPGTKVWVLVEDEPGSVTVSVRDDGCGIAPERLDEAAAQGRLGVAQSIKGRIADLGGTVQIISAPDEGTEVELTVPRGPIS
jgi:signal transduction histidine kinase